MRRPSPESGKMKEGIITTAQIGRNTVTLKNMFWGADQRFWNIKNMIYAAQIRGLPITLVIIGYVALAGHPSSRMEMSPDSILAGQHAVGFDETALTSPVELLS